MTNSAAASTSTPTVLWSKPVPDRAGTPLLIMFHGYGSDEADLFSLAELLPPSLPSPPFGVPSPSGQGHAWFPLRTDISYSLEAVKSCTTDLADWIDTVRGQHSSVSLLGFSQGMCMATSLIRHRPHDFAAVVGLSGFAVDDEGDPFFQDTELAKAGLPVFWGRDQADPVIPEASVEYTNAWLRDHTRLTKVLYNGIWHGINAQEMAHVKEFLTLTVLAEA